MDNDIWKKYAFKSKRPEDCKTMEEIDAMKPTFPTGGNVITMERYNRQMDTWETQNN